MNNRRVLRLIGATSCTIFIAMPMQAGQPSNQVAAGVMRLQKSDVKTPANESRISETPIETATTKAVTVSAQEMVSTVPLAPTAPAANASKFQKKDIKTSTESLSTPMPDQQGRMLDVMIFTGMGETESEKNPAITSSFAFALCQNATPLIVSSWVFNTFLSMKSKGQHFKDIEINPFEWNVYVNKTQTLFTLIPVKYAEKLANNYAKNIKEYPEKTKCDYTAEDILIGLNVSKLTRITADRIKEYSHLSTDDISKAITKHKTIPITDFTSLFVQGRDDIFGMWNIILEGHGAYPTRVDFAAKTAKAIDVSNAFLASFTITEFRELIQFFIKKIKVNFLYYSTCYGGDYNLILPYMTTLINERGSIVGDIQKPNFTVVSGSVTGQSVVTIMGTSIRFCKEITKSPEIVIKNMEIPYEEKPFISFKGFFDLLHAYGSERPNRPVLYKEAELKKILLEVTMRAHGYGLSALPQIMYPGTEVFRAISLTDKIAVIGEVFTRQHIMEKKPITLHNKDAILIYPKVISVNLNIIRQRPHRLPTIISMLPGIGLNKFASITTNLDFDDFVRIFWGMEPVFRKYYYIEQVTLPSDKEFLPFAPEGQKITLHNVLIFQWTDQLILLFEDPKKEAIYFGYYSDEERKPIINKAYGLVTKTIPHDEFLNTLHDYFIGSKVIGSELFEFEDMIKKLLLTQEERDTLSKYTTTNAQNKTADQTTETKSGWFSWIRNWCRK